jgi:cytochrome c556
MLSLASLILRKGNNMKNCKLCWSLVAVLLIIVGLFAYKFTVGNVQPSDDGRQAVMLSKDEHNALLLEMRMWLQNSQGILAAASKKDFDEVIRSAKASGMGAEAETPGSLFRKLPVEMKALGFDTRRKFDAIAADADKFKDSNLIVSKLSEAMNNCIACHATYRFVETSE